MYTKGIKGVGLTGLVFPSDGESKSQGKDQHFQDAGTRQPSQESLGSVESVVFLVHSGREGQRTVVSMGQGSGLRVFNWQTLFFVLSKILSYFK